MLTLIYRRLPCLVDQRHMGQVCRSWRDAVAAPAPAGPPPARRRRAPFLLLRRRRRLPQPRFPRPRPGTRCRYFGSCDGGWLFLAIGQVYGHKLLNLPPDELHFDLPNFVRMHGPSSACTGPTGRRTSPWPYSPQPSPRRRSKSTSTASSPRPSSPPGRVARSRTSMCLGHQPPVAIGAAATTPITSPCLEDVINRNGAFHFLTRDEHLLVYTPKIMTIQFFLPGPGERMLRRRRSCSLPRRVPRRTADGRQAHPS
ncbi:hypothetical protein E2562_029859 [Oryza meyeriana var. granulata]|uniref:F-box domain-containing protein n=1 Tax=Oryza meyeriana var. granulata TaxID=110450 RepID=A0A6G1ER99_9ORYZ|nr:hypothetical protein E2562_029859 [Oryza meyeriana var. granulata]